MKGIRGKDTAVEWRFRRALFKRGVRYRKNYAPVPGTPDVAIVGDKIAIFVDGDFWHGNGWRRRKLSSLEEQFPTNTEYWVGKIRRNMARDQEVNDRLVAAGWTVMRFWENDVLKDVDSCADEVVGELSKKHR